MKKARISNILLYVFPIVLNIVLVLIEIFGSKQIDVFESIKTGIWNIILLEIFLIVAQLFFSFGNLPNNIKSFFEAHHMDVRFEHKKLWDELSQVSEMKLVPIIAELQKHAANELTDACHSLRTSQKISVYNSDLAAILGSQIANISKINILCRPNFFDHILDLLKIIKNFENLDFNIIFLCANDKNETEMLDLSQNNILLNVKNKVRYVNSISTELFHSYVIIINNEIAVLSDIANKSTVTQNPKDLQYFISEHHKLMISSQPTFSTHLFEDIGITAFYGKDEFANIQHHLFIDNIKTMLDVGTGAGRLLKHFVDKDDIQIIALDRDLVALEQCKSNYKAYSNIHYLNKDFLLHDFGEQKFDLIIAYNSIYHCDYDSFNKTIAQMRNLLSNGGYLLLTLKTLAGNENVYKNAINIEEGTGHYTYLNCNYPDGDVPHHFCTDTEINNISILFSKIIYQEEIPLVERFGRIVQGKGKMFILQK